MAQRTNLIRIEPRAAVATGTTLQRASILPEPETDGRGRIYCPLLQDWRMEKPEERVRQSFVLHLHQNLGYSLEAMVQEQRVQHGRHSPKTDIVVWETPEKRAQRRTPVIVVECKAENVDIHPRDFYQGESYARAVACEFLVMHNVRKTAYFKLVPGLPGELVQINEVPKAADWGDARRINAIKNATRAFSRDEFRDLLFKCHSILRDVHKMEPGRAFDAISKTLFITDPAAEILKL